MIHNTLMIRLSLSLLLFFACTNATTCPSANNRPSWPKPCASAQIYDPLSLPQDDALAEARVILSTVSKQLYLYQTRADGALPAGSYNGTLGVAAVSESVIKIPARITPVTQALLTPILPLLPQLTLSSLSDYESLYAPFASSAYGLPSGINGTIWKTDEWFVAMALSAQGWSLRQVRGALPFPLADADVTGLLPAYTTLAAELAAGRLYMADYSLLDAVPNETGKYVGGSIALFVADSNAKLSVLAIRASATSPVCTPADGADWLLAKINHQAAHFYMVQANHLLKTHMAWEPVWTSINRNMAVNHPVGKTLLHYLHFCYGFFPVASVALFPANTAFDIIFAKGGPGEIPLMVAMYTSFNFTQTAFETDIITRGVQGLSNFVYRDQGSAINAAIRSLMHSIVEHYYRTDARVAGDSELAAMVLEVSALLPGFPSAISTKCALVDFMTHTAFSLSAQHAVQNGKHPYTYSALPYAPAALYQPLPTVKGTVSTEADLLPWLPNFTRAVAQIQAVLTYALPVDPINSLSGSQSQIGLGSSLNQAIRRFQSTLAQLQTQFEAEAAVPGTLVPFKLFYPQNLPYWGWV
eukprot:TRINITY_DN4549_c0_g1_i1.p1 TRINITY_DN4549_c0_g1~~TRINITY_DN4549_c0_g1_i1.p1  ORF type:complete len:584 (-),score=76.99 TRINITY_DN4549_c0_g1_i1:121-1872(-)